MLKKSSEMLNLGLIGANIQHTQSPTIYKKLLKQKFNYHIIEIPQTENLPTLKEIFEKYRLDGLSITSPYKKNFLKEANEKNLSSINCVKNMNDGFRATSTDYLAMKQIIKNKYSPHQVIILGDGAMASLIEQICQELGVNHLIFSRKKNGDIAKLDLSAISSKSLVINSCSRAFAFEGKLSKSSIFWDLNYNFTPHIQYFSKRSDWIYEDGLEMLELQCQLSLKFWDLS